MVQRTSAAHTPEIENTGDATTPRCCHHWVIQPADGPVSNGSCQVCGETREFKNYVESATWGDSRRTAKGTSVAAATDSTSDDEDMGGPDTAGEEPEPDIGPDDSEIEMEVAD